jgi:C-terminal processing protease CtpA/Prc
VTGEPVDEALERAGGGEPKAWPPVHRNYDDLSLLPPEESGPRTERDFRCMGTTRVAIPRDATVIMMDPFVAYYHPTPKGNVGYLRLPQYTAVNPTNGRVEYEQRFAQYEYAVSVLEANTVGLIIDQDHNCGGSVDWLHRIVGLFAAEPFKPTQFRLLANKEEYFEFKEWLATVRGTLIGAGVERVLGLVTAAWERGDFLTSMTALDGTATIAPHSVRYTKPIIVTIDEMSGSGGDAFPAILQGIGRAKLLGTRTMGAGGHVVEQPALFFSRLGSRMTKSLFYRPDGVPVENNGAEPDYPYTITRDDFLYGYRGYQAFYVSKLLERI